MESEVHGAALFGSHRRPIARLAEHSSSESTEVSPNGCEEGGEGLGHSLSQANLLGTVFISRAAVTNYHKLHWWLKATEMYSLTVLQAPSPKSR